MVVSLMAGRARYCWTTEALGFRAALLQEEGLVPAWGVAGDADAGRHTGPVAEVGVTTAALGHRGADPPGQDLVRGIPESVELEIGRLAVVDGAERLHPPFEDHHRH